MSLKSIAYVDLGSVFWDERWKNLGRNVPGYGILGPKVWELRWMDMGDIFIFIHRVIHNQASTVRFQLSKRTMVNTK